MNSASVESEAYATRGLPHYWTPEQVRQILAITPAGRPWLFALLLWRSELRQAEALDPQWRDLNFAAAAPTIKSRKGTGGPLPRGSGPSGAGGLLPVGA